MRCRAANRRACAEPKAIIEHMFVSGWWPVSDFQGQGSLLALTEASARPWHEVADLVVDAGSARSVLEGQVTPYGEADAKLVRALRTATTEAMVERWKKTVAATLERLPETSLITVLDPEYPE